MVVFEKNGVRVKPVRGQGMQKKFINTKKLFNIIEYLQEHVHVFIDAQYIMSSDIKL